MSNKILYQLMSKQSLTQTQLSKETGIPQPTLSRILSGDTQNPRLSSIVALAQYFGVTLDQLVGDMR